MEIEFNKLNLNINLENKKIIGFIGNNYLKVINSLINDDYICKINNKEIKLNTRRDIGYINKGLDFKTNNVIDELSLKQRKNEDNNKRIDKVLEYLNIKNIKDKKINALSNSEKRLLQYAKNIIYNPKIIIIDEPFLFLDYERKLEIVHLIKDLCYQYNKIIIIGSHDVNIIYELTNMTLIMNKNILLFDETKKVFENLDYKCYNIEQPELIRFTNIARKKGKKINYYQDIRDLMKEVYRNV